MAQTIKLTRPPLVRRAMVVEAALCLMLARLALRVVPFRYLTWFFERQTRRPEVEGPERIRLRQNVCSAIFRAKRHLPGETVCFPLAIATQAMLRRRGVGTVLYYGAARSNGEGLLTHVWVQDGEEGIVGHQISNDYRVLARYPNAM